MDTVSIGNRHIPLYSVDTCFLCCGRSWSRSALKKKEGTVPFAGEAMITKSGAEQIPKTCMIRFQGVLSVV
jgi:hypothetical protein